MPNISFGQNSDPSGLFAGLSRAYLQDQEALLRDAAQRQDEVQDAADKDMFDKWKNGLISDDAWLAYINQRVEDTAGDEKEHQSWVELQREYTVAIADDKAEFQYNNGEITIHQLIAYYEGRRKGLNKDSQEWREVTLKINEFVDKAAADDITAGAQDIADRVAVGAATLGDLKAYYEGKLKGLRKNSPLYEQIAGEIRDLQSQIATGGGGYRTSGGGGGGGNGGLSPSEAYEYATGSGFIMPDEVLLDHARRNDRGVSAGAASFSGFIPGMTESEVDDFLDANSKYYETILQQWGDGDTARDPNTGELIDGTPENRRAVAYALIDSLEQQRIAAMTGNKINESADQGFGRRQIAAINNYILPANALEFETEAMPIVTRAAEMDIASLEATSNFSGTALSASNLANELERLVNRQTKKRTRFLETADESPVGEKFGASKGSLHQLPEETIKTLQGQILGLRLAGNGDVDGLARWLEENRDEKGMDWLAGDNGYLTRTYGMQSTARNVATGASGLVYDSLQGGLVEVPMTVAPELSPTPYYDYRAAGISFDPDAGDELVTIFIDGPGGRPIPVKAVARTVSPPNKLSLYSNSDKMFLSADMIRSLGKEQIQEQIASGDLEPRPAAQFLSVTYTDNSGRRITMYRHENGGWTGRPEFSTDDNVEGFVPVGPGGQLSKRLKPFAHSRMVPAPYFGTNAEELQRMFDRGEIDLGMLGYGPDGMLTPDTVPTAGVYYDDTFQKKGYSYADPELADFRRGRAREEWVARTGFMEGSDIPSGGTDITRGRSFGGSWGDNSFTEGPIITGIKAMAAGLGMFFGDYYSNDRPIWRPFAGPQKAATGSLDKLSLTERYANYRPAPGDVRRANAARAASDALPKITLPKPNTKVTETVAKLPSITTARIVSRETLARRAGITPTQKAPVALPKATPTKTTTTVSKPPITRRPVYKQPSRY